MDFLIIAIKTYKYHNNMHVVNSCNRLQLLFLNCILLFATVIYSLSAWEDLVDNDCNDGTKVERGNVGEFWKTLFSSLFCCSLFKCKSFRGKKKVQNLINIQ